MDEQELKDFIEFTTGETFTEPEEVDIPSQWDMYITYLDENKALILLDLSLAQIAPIMGYDQVFGVQIAINQPTEDGFYTDSEQPELFAIEDRVEEIFTREAGCRFVATVTTAGTRMMYFYAKETNVLPSLVGKVAAEYKEHRFDYLIQPDAQWNFYFSVLYPSVIELQLMRNRQVVQRMMEAGEDLEAEHEVCHWFYFGNGADRRQAAFRLKNRGYDIIDDNFYEEKLAEYPYGLRVSLHHPLTLEALNEQTYNHDDFIAEYDGVYDGWELMPDGDKTDEWL